MARTENTKQESTASENAITKTILVNEELNDGPESTSLRNECISVKVNCAHLNKAIDTNQIRKSIDGNGGFKSLRCISCKSNPITGNNNEDHFLCLKCGECCCSNHVQRHFKTPRSDLHLLYVNINDWSVQCVECDIAISAEVSGKLDFAIKILRSFQNKSKDTIKTFKPEPVSVVNSESIPSTNFCRNSELQSFSSTMIGSKSASSLISPRGLCNLGNTCFFNSVLQCLSRTPFLIEVLLEMKEPGEKVTIKLENYTPVEVELRESWGPVTENLVATLLQITTINGGGAFSPAHLLDALRKKHMQFMGFNQHDSHELLRQLLDCVKNEDLRRFKMEILRYFKLSSKLNPNEIDEEKKKIAKEMSTKLTELVNVRPDPVFRGFTVSLNRCTMCKYKSEIPESFLDLSLPVSFLRMQSLSMMNRRKSDLTNEKPKSKNQLKKERKQARKNKKTAKMKKRFVVAEDQRNKNVENVMTEIKDVNESGYSSGKASSPVQNGSDTAISTKNSNDILAEALNEINATDDYTIETEKSENNGNPNSVSEDASCSGGIAVDSSSTDNRVDGTLNGKLNNYDEASTSSYHSTATELNHNQLGFKWATMSSLSETTETAPKVIEMWNSDSSLGYPLVNSSDCSTSKSDNNLLPGLSSCSDDEDLDDENEDDDNDGLDSNEDEFIDNNMLEADDMCATLQPPRVDNEEENSIWACLREYTKCEMLTGNNKVVCEKCTKDYNKNSSEKKQIYRNFTKQLLIKSPPPVLILHLKRFEAKGAFSFRKVDTNITFPLTLDVGSFCSVTCDNLLYPNQKNILYSLYGIVEHSGSLNAGHYVAYVKVRSMNKYSYRKLFLPKGMRDETESVSEKDFEHVKNELKNEDRQWYYISDSSVRPIAEEDVLRKQAYLLFYERIW